MGHRARLFRQCELKEWGSLVWRLRSQGAWSDKLIDCLGSISLDQNWVWLVGQLKELIFQKSTLVEGLGMLRCQGDFH